MDLIDHGHAADIKKRSIIITIFVFVRNFDFEWRAIDLRVELSHLRGHKCVSIIMSFNARGKYRTATNCVLRLSNTNRTSYIIIRSKRRLYKT